MILLVNGPNPNLLGEREPGVRKTTREIEDMVRHSPRGLEGGGGGVPVEPRGRAHRLHPGEPQGARGLIVNSRRAHARLRAPGLLARWTCPPSRSDLRTSTRARSSGGRERHGAGVPCLSSAWGRAATCSPPRSGSAPRPPGRCGSRASKGGRARGAARPCQRWRAPPATRPGRCGRRRPILRQTERDLALVCVDDGSTDGTSRSSPAWPSGISRLAVVRGPGEGIGRSARPRPLRRAEIVARMDVDDVAHPERLSPAAGGPRGRSRLVAVGARVRLFLRRECGTGCAATPAG